MRVTRPQDERTPRPALGAAGDGPGVGRSPAAKTHAARAWVALDQIAENRLLARWARLLPRPAGTLAALHEADAELLPLPGAGTLAVTVDTVAEEIELGLYRSPQTAGRVAAVASLSDLAAVGADALGLLLSVTLPRDDTSHAQEEVARGVAAACDEAGTGVVGGDTNVGCRLAVATVGIGLVPAGVAPLRRVGLHPGDWLFASGPLGAGGALAATHWLGGARAAGDAVFRPRVSLAIGRALRGVASACMDTSDGLVTTLDQLARLNGVAIRVERPLDALLCPEARHVSRTLALPPFVLLAGLHGEFELVFGVPEERLGALERTALEPLLLGRVVEGSGLAVQGQPLDGARVRNLFDACEGDIAEYARRLAALDPESAEVTRCDPGC